MPKLIFDDDPGAGIRELVQEQIRQRRYEPVVRLEFGPGADADIREMLRGRFELSPADVYDLPESSTTPRCSRSRACRFPRCATRPGRRSPSALPEEGARIFDAIHAGDILVHHPYESFDASVEHFISTAADDPQTVSIKMTAYRVGDDTPFVKSLIRAAEHGKQVACVMEIKARFDEERNLHWAAELERVGAHVTFGVSGLKTHGKTALVVRKEARRPPLLCAHRHRQLPREDSAPLRRCRAVHLRPTLTHDVVNLFHYLTGHAKLPIVQTVWWRPARCERRFLELIQREIENLRAGRPARIVAKMNQLEDPDIIEALCEASEAGVPIDLIIRGFCCLRPGVPGRTGEHPHPVDHRSLPRTFADFLFCQRTEESARGRLFHRIGRLDVPEPLQAR